MQFAFRKYAPSIALIRCRDGERAVEYLENRGEFACGESWIAPPFVLLDLNLPRMSGHEVLEYIRHSAHSRSLPVVIFTSSSNPKEVASCYRSGANSYFIKPFDLGKMTSLMEMLIRYWLQDAQLPAYIGLTLPAPG